MAGIVQRAQSSTQESSGFDFSNSEEIQQLLEEQRKIQEEGNRLLDESTKTLQLEYENKR